MRAILRLAACRHRPGNRGAPMVYEAMEMLPRALARLCHRGEMVCADRRRDERPDLMARLDEGHRPSPSDKRRQRLSAPPSLLGGGGGRNAAMVADRRCVG